MSRGLYYLVASLPRGAPVITHLCFADDHVIFTRGLKKSVRELVTFLHLFEEVSGQRIN